MKKIVLIISILILLASCEKEVLYNDYVKLSMTSFTFDSKDIQPLEVEVQTNDSKEWDAMLEEGDWIEFSKEEGKLVITAKENENSEPRSATLAVTSGNAKSVITLNQLAYGFSGSFVDFPLQSYGGISRNGLFAGYVNPIQNQATGNLSYECKVYNTETGEVKELEVPTVKAWDGSETGRPYEAVTCISNDGNSILFSHDSQARSAVVSNGEEVELKLPEGYQYPTPKYFSSDASVVVGTCKFAADRMSMPVVWRNGEPEILEIPEFLANGIPMPSNGVIARGCSDDGSVIYGSEWKLMGLIYWKDGKMVDMASKYAEPIDEYKVAIIQTHSSTTNISPNGKFIAAYFNANGSGSLGAEYYPVVINTETEEATIYRDYQGYMGIHAMNDGTIFVQRQLSGDGAAVIDYATGELKPVSEWSKDRYGLSISDSRFVQYISSDEQVIYGNKAVNTGLGFATPGWYLRR